jgi:antitoxin (DNA-binding transcriptional repressor) of toxin-antitoxin stability system
MTEMSISQFKATCLAVRRTGVPVRVTRRGEPMADILPPGPNADSQWLGCLSDSIEIEGDIVGPIGAFDGWEVSEQ